MSNDPSTHARFGEKTTSKYCAAGSSNKNVGTPVYKNESGTVHSAAVHSFIRLLSIIPSAEHINKQTHAYAGSTFWCVRTFFRSNACTGNIKVCP